MRLSCLKAISLLPTSSRCSPRVCAQTRTHTSSAPCSPVARHTKGQQKIICDIAHNVTSPYSFAPKEASTHQGDNVEHDVVCFGLDDIGDRPGTLTRARTPARWSGSGVVCSCQQSCFVWVSVGFDEACAVYMTTSPHKLGNEPSQTPKVSSIHNLGSDAVSVVSLNKSTFG